jgi:hypothetical protein
LASWPRLEATEPAADPAIDAISAIGELVVWAAIRDASIEDENTLDGGLDVSVVAVALDVPPPDPDDVAEPVSKFCPAPAAADVPAPTSACIWASSELTEFV